MRIVIEGAISRNSKSPLVLMESSIAEILGDAHGMAQNRALGWNSWVRRMRIPINDERKPPETVAQAEPTRVTIR
jgi:hypothetical protein